MALGKTMAGRIAGLAEAALAPLAPLAGGQVSAIAETQHRPWRCRIVRG